MEYKFSKKNQPAADPDFATNLHLSVAFKPRQTTHRTSCVEMSQLDIVGRSYSCLKHPCLDFYDTLTLRVGVTGSNMVTCLLGWVHTPKPKFNILINMPCFVFSSSTFLASRRRVVASSSASSASSGRSSTAF